MYGISYVIYSQYGKSGYQFFGFLALLIFIVCIYSLVIFGNNDTSRYKMLAIIHRQDKKLAQYEDAEEQGLLLRLPCPIGTEVYEIEKEYYITLKGCKGCIYFGNNVIVLKKFNMCMFEDFGKTVFLTKEEAEQKLKEI